MKRISSILFFCVVFCEIESGRTRLRPSEQGHGNPSATILQQALVQQLPNNQLFNGFPYPQQNQQPKRFVNEPSSTSNSVQPPEKQPSLQLQVIHQPLNVYNQPRHSTGFLQQNQNLGQQPQILMNPPMNSTSSPLTSYPQILPTPQTQQTQISVNSNARMSPGLSPILPQHVTPSLNQQALPYAPTPLNPLGPPLLTSYSPITTQSGFLPHNQQSLQQTQIPLNQPVGFHLRPTPLTSYSPISQQPVPQQPLGYGRVYPMEAKAAENGGPAIPNSKAIIGIPFDNFKINPEEETTTVKPKRRKEETVHTEEEVPVSNDNNNDDDNDE